MNYFTYLECCCFFIYFYNQGDGQRARLKLLGLKYLPALSRFQAQELSPYEVGEQLYLDSLENLMSSPALVCALRQVEASASLRKLLPHNYPGNVSALMSPTPEAAFRQASLFFFEHEMTPGRFCRMHWDTKFKISWGKVQRLKTNKQMVLCV